MFLLAQFRETRAYPWGRVDCSRCVQQHTMFGVEPRLRRS
jgi:hypothetical protein